jgi:hypothetical protein
MEKRAIDVAKALVRLSALTTFELRGEWRRLHRMPPPMRLSRDLLIRGIIYQLQERAYGGLSMATARKLEQAAAGPPSRGAAKPTQPISLRPGTRLVREWHGVTHTALIHADGIEWRGQRFRSLSVVARTITGARWSGPRALHDGGYVTPHPHQMPEANRRQNDGDETLRTSGDPATFRTARFRGFRHDRHPAPHPAKSMRRFYQLGRAGRS